MAVLPSDPSTDQLMLRESKPPPRVTLLVLPAPPYMALLDVGMMGGSRMALQRLSSVSQERNVIGWASFEAIVIFFTM